MCQRQLLWGGLAGVLLASVAGCGRQTSAAPSQGGPDKAAQAPAVPIGQPLVQTVTDYEDFTGHTEAVNSIEIRARVTGYLVEGLKDGGPNKEGTEVKKGELLFEIDPRSYQADKDKAEATLVQAQAHLDRLSKDLARAEKLLAGRSIAEGDYDQTVGDHNEAAAAVKTAQAALDLAKLNLAWTKVYAPCDGRVSRQLIDPGNMVQADHDRADHDRHARPDLRLFRRRRADAVGTAAHGSGAEGKAGRGPRRQDQAPFGAGR